MEEEELGPLLLGKKEGTRCEVACMGAVVLYAYYPSIHHLLVGEVPIRRCLHGDDSLIHPLRMHVSTHVYCSMGASSFGEVCKIRYIPCTILGYSLAWTPKAPCGPPDPPTL